MKVFFNLQQLFRILLGFLKGKTPLTNEVESHYIVWPWMTEFFMTLQASEFPQMTDSARWELASRIGLVSKIYKKKGVAVVTGQKIIYRRPIPIFSRVRVTSQLVGLQDSWMFIKHRFYAKNKLCAISWVKLAIRNKDGAINMNSVFDVEITTPEDIHLIFACDSVFLKEEENI